MSREELRNKIRPIFREMPNCHDLIDKDGFAYGTRNKEFYVTELTDFILANFEPKERAKELEEENKRTNAIALGLGWEWAVVTRDKEELTAELAEAKLILLEAKKLAEYAFTAQAGDWIAIEPTFTKIRNFIASPTGTDLLAKVERYENVYKTLRAILEDHKRMGTEYTQDYYIEKLLDEAIDAGKEKKE